MTVSWPYTDRLNQTKINQINFFRAWLRLLTINDIDPTAGYDLIFLKLIFFGNGRNQYIIKKKKKSRAKEIIFTQPRLQQLVGQHFCFWQIGWERPRLVIFNDPCPACLSLPRLTSDQRAITVVVIRGYRTDDDNMWPSRAVTTTVVTGEMCVYCPMIARQRIWREEMFKSKTRKEKENSITRWWLARAGVT